MRRTPRFTIFLLALLCLSFVASASGGAPNIVYILADDLGYGDLGCYGQERIQTPRLDRLAAEGMRFTDHYAGSPVCAPSRCVLMTGKHAGHATRRGNRPYIPLSETEITVAKILREAGYRTGIIGKWGLADTTLDFEPGTTARPNERGFDYFYGFLNQRHAWNYYPDFVWENENMIGLNGAKYIHDAFTEKSLEFIRENREGPFCLFLWYTTPHVNNAFKHTDDCLPVPSLEPYEGEDWPLIEKKYAAMVTRLDRDVGRVLDLLAELKIADDTIVMFTSDNGAQSYAPHDKEFFASTAGLREYKMAVYEGGIRTPLLVRWPGVVEAGSVSGHVSAFWDVLPTFAEIAGKGSPEGLDGISFLPALKGEAQEKHEYLYWELQVKGNLRQAIRRGDWKALRLAVDGATQVYHLGKDLREERDLAGENPEMVAEFDKLFRDARTESEHWPVEW